MRDTQENYESYTGTPKNPIILQCPNCHSYPVKRVNWDGKRYSCEVCEGTDGKE